MRLMAVVKASFHTVRPYTDRTDSHILIHIRLVLGTHLGPTTQPWSKLGSSEHARISFVCFHGV